MLLILLDVLLAMQVISAVEAVEALRHDGARITTWACSDIRQEKEDTF